MLVDRTPCAYALTEKRGAGCLTRRRVTFYTHKVASNMWCLYRILCNDLICDGNGRLEHSCHCTSSRLREYSRARTAASSVLLLTSNAITNPAQRGAYRQFLSFGDAFSPAVDFNRLLIIQR
ncbi:jg18880 [Pararge aegeria aegeria]|uniref:Jg18880 protein n=1 Tax=Pararge aegeria aegeria TaxID=348720 RepID=A0A8S4RSH2_9NEOP|nr:jg18880 [Pararge aegeria aegeria]